MLIRTRPRDRFKNRIPALMRILSISHDAGKHYLIEDQPSALDGHSASILKRLTAVWINSLARKAGKEALSLTPQRFGKTSDDPFAGKAT